MKRFQTSILLTWLVCILLPAGIAIGAEPSAETSFKRGTQAFASGNYEQALAFFELARKAGLNTTALHYNLGVTYFKLRRYDESRKEFEGLTGDAVNAPLAHYNLGKIALLQGERSKAKDHFQIASRTATDKKLRNLANDQLRELTAREEEGRLSGYLSFAGGYDDNVRLTADGETVVGNVDDNFLEFIGSATGQLAGTNKRGLQLKATGYYLDYLKENEFDFGDLRLGPEVDYRIGRWDTSLGAFGDFSYIDKESFERVFITEAKGTREIYRNVDLRLRYQLSLIDAQTPYEDLSGTRHRMSAGLRSTLLGIYTRLEYTFELNDRDNPDFPIRHGIDLLADRDLTDKWSAGVNASYRYSDYQETERSDDRIWLGMRVSRRIPWGFSLFGKYDYIRNASNFQENDYTSNVVSIGLERFF